MSKKVTCRDAGYDCDFVVQSENEVELIEMVRMHANDTHNLQMSDADVRGMAVEV